MHKLAIYLILMAFWCGCNMTNPADPAVISTIQAEMQIDLANPFGAPSQFAFQLSTLEERCADAQILADGATQGQNVHLAISGLLVEPDCSGDYNRIQKDVNIDLSPGDYDFSMAIGDDLFNTGVLSFDGIAYTLEMYSILGVKIGHSKLFKIPEGVIWGSISGDQGISEIKDDFLSALNTLTSAAGLPEGYYGHFTIKESDILNLESNNNIAYESNHLFVYRLIGSSDGLQFVIDNFRAQYGDVINITCTTWTGDSF